MIRYKVLYWRDIPAQIKVYGEGRPVAKPLPDRFQEEIDRVAMREGLHESDAYLEAWQWSEMREFDGGAENAAESIVEELISAFDDGGK
jgi:hypothetical protein